MKKKKNVVLLLISLMIFPFMLTEVKAASAPYNWIVDGETVDTTNANGTATLTKDSTNIVLTLNNYNGGPLELNCYGTAQSGLTFTIHLIGENSIATEEGTGIAYNYENKIQFTGDGKLTIKAPQPISYENYATKLYISPSEQIYTDTPNEIQESNTISGSKDKEESNNNQATQQVEKSSATENHIILYIVVGGYVLLSLIVIIYLMIQNKKKNNL